MTRPILTCLLLAAILPGLAGCGDSKPAASGTVTMHGMEVVDGTANDSMTDLDNATQEGTLLTNGGELPPQGTHGAPMGNSAYGGTSGTNSAEPASNASAAQ